MARTFRFSAALAIAATAACNSEPTGAILDTPHAAGAAIGGGSSGGRIVVTESDITRQAENTPPTDNWVYYFRSPTSTGAFVTGPGNPPLGVGSFLMNTPTTADKGTLFNFDHIGTRLADITEISYATYRDPSSLATSPSIQLPSINIQIDPDGAGPLTFATLVYEPVYNVAADAIETGVWQTWNAESGIWWTTRPINGPDGPGTCLPTVCYISWDDIVRYNPDAVILGGFGVNQGSGSGGLVAATDALTIGYDGTTWTYDFEPFRGPASKDDCKDGGWKNLRDENGEPFKNQGQCVSYANRASRE